MVGGGEGSGRPVDGDGGVVVRFYPVSSSSGSSLARFIRLSLLISVVMLLLWTGSKVVRWQLCFLPKVVCPGAKQVVIR